MLRCLLHSPQNGIENFCYESNAIIGMMKMLLCICREMGGPEIRWKSGRTDASTAAPPSEDRRFSPDGRLPAASDCPAHIRDVFYRMGFDDREIVALVGAHAVGRCHSDRSGYVNPWTRSPTTFSNEFFRELLENTWTIKKWDGPEQYEDPTGEIMMLPADMALIEDPKFRKYVELYAKDEDLWFKDFSKAFSKLLHLRGKRKKFLGLF